MRNKNSALLRRILYPATGLLAGLAVAVAQCPAHAEPIRPADAVRALPAPLAELVGAVLSALENRAPLAISPPPPRYAPGTAIVVLGYGLLPDGTMRSTLVDRLRAGWLEAVLAPAAPVIVTGGNPHNGITEADAMAQWLVGHGIAPERIHREPLARSTVENASHSARLMREIGATTAVIVTSADHIDRAATDFAAAGIPIAATVTAEQLPEPAARLLRARGA
ncbi:YdcF family protein [Nocardia brasiliensis]